MKPVHQTIFYGDPRKGNCFQAAVASVLELPLESVPHVMQSDDWLQKFLTWLQPMGLWYLDVTINPDMRGHFFERFSGFHLMHGESPRGGCRHTIVGRGGVIAHDPHPDGTGLTGDDIEYGLFVPCDPSKWPELREQSR